MTVVIVATALLAYLATAALTARHLYGHWRAKEIDAHVADSIDTDVRIYHKPPKTQAEYTDAAVHSFNTISRGFVQAGAFACALVWPASLICITAAHLVARFLNDTPVRSRSELAADVETRDKRIAELEQQLGYGDGP